MVALQEPVVSTHEKEAPMSFSKDSKLVALVLVTLAGALAGCEGPGPLGAESGALHGRATDVAGQAEFDVEVRYAGGASRQEAQRLLSGLQIVAARDFLGDGAAPPAPAGDEPLDDSEPTIAVLLKPLNPAAQAQRYAWRASLDARAPAAPAAPEGAVEQRQGALTLDLDLDPTWLSNGETWRTSRYRCNWFSFGVHVAVGFVQPCILQGAQGLAGTTCGPFNTAITSIGDANPFNEHYFRGRASGYLTGGELVGVEVVCL
jgi:hypothetical protein